MHRITDYELKTIIHVAIKTAPKTVKQGLRSKLPIQNDSAVSQLAAYIVSHISNDSYMVIQTDFVKAEKPVNDYLGKWGIHEPDPTDFVFLTTDNQKFNKKPDQTSE